jgi:uncharacterized membrane protein
MKTSDLVVKVVMWRLISIFVTLLIMYAATGDVKSATGITLLLHTVLTTCHYTFEKYWKRLYETR